MERNMCGIPSFQNLCKPCEVVDDLIIKKSFLNEMSITTNREET